MQAVTKKDGKREWYVLAVKLPAEPSRHRVAVWRELRRAGAISLGQSVWALPAAPAFNDNVGRAIDLAERAGEVLFLDARGHDHAHAQRLQDLFTAGREEEWTEFISDCMKYKAELEHEIAQQKLTVAELDEEEQSLERLRRWFRELKLRDLFGAPSAAEAEQELKQCQTRLEDFANRVYAAVHQS